MSRVFVVGSINVDLVCQAGSFPRPGETLTGSDFAIHSGGKGANQAVAAARCGVPTAMVGRVGDDSFGREQRAHLEAARVSVEHVRETAGVSTGVALIVVSASGENSIVVVPGANGRLDPADVELPCAAGDVVVCQFEIPRATVEAVFTHARARGATTVLNPAPAQAWPEGSRALADVVVVNETELGFFLDRPVADPTDSAAVLRDAAALRAAPGQVVIATLGPHGLVASTPEGDFVVRGHRVEVVDTTGAGDTFVGCLAARLVAGDVLEEALDYANLAASLCVERAGAGPSIPTEAQVEKRLRKLAMS